jgi:MFS family permease
MENKNRITGSDLRRSLNLNIIAITFGMCFFTVTQGPALTGFTRALGAGDLVYGVIMAMPVVGGVLQIFASYFIENTGRRKMIFLISGLIHRLIWIPIAIIPLLVPAQNKLMIIWAVTVLITLASSANSITGIAFWSWMGALVPMEIRGRFFSRRTMISTIAGALAGLAAGKYLGTEPSLKQFSIIFFVVALIGTIDIILFIWIKNPLMEVPKEKIPFFQLFFEPYGNRNYVRYITFVTVWNFGINIAGPFFNVYLNEHLKMSYFLMSLFAQVAANVATVIFIRHWGRFVDKYGNKPIISLCTSVIIILPFIWCFATPSNYWPILCLNFAAGIFWPGYEIASNNLAIWLAPEKNRSIYIANFALITSVFGIALANICGGLFMEYTRPLLAQWKIPFISGQKLNSFHLLFIMSGLIRLIAHVFFLHRAKEENEKSPRLVLDDIFRFMKPKTENYISK